MDNISNSKPSTTTGDNTILRKFKFMDVLLVASFLYMTYNALEGLLKADSYCTVAFVLTAYTCLILLFWCIQEFDRTPAQAAKKKQRLKVAIAALALILNVSFTYRVAAILDSPVMSIIVWTMGVAMTVGGFYGLFLMPQVTDPQQPPASWEKSDVCNSFAKV